MSPNNTYPKNEKLKSRKVLESLFAKGKSLNIFPIKVFYSIEATDVPTSNEILVKTGVGASSRNFKKAVDRNKIKRLLREVYRTQKQDLLAKAKNKNIQLSLFFLFIGKELPQYADLNVPMEKLLEKLLIKVEQWVSPM
jgi:ribonuclease P protein component